MTERISKDMIIADMLKVDAGMLNYVYKFRYV